MLLWQAFDNDLVVVTVRALINVWRGPSPLQCILAGFLLCLCAWLPTSWHRRCFSNSNSVSFIVIKKTH